MASEDGAAAQGEAGGLGVDIAANPPRSKINIRATGLAAATVLGFLALFGVLTYLDPLHDPRHFVLALVAAFGSGALLDASMQAARMADALKEKDFYREEVNRMAKEKSRLEEALLNRRLSSSGRAAEPPSKERENKRTKRER